MKFFEGSTRSVLRIGNLVFKYPKVKKILYSVFQGDFKAGYRYLLFALKANVEEFFCWQSTKAAFLAPTYFSLIIFNVQKYIKGRDVTEEEIRNILFGVCFFVRKGKKFSLVDPHILDRNFKHTPEGYILIDYSNMRFGYPLVRLIKKRKSKFTQALGKK